MSRYYSTTLNTIFGLLENVSAVRTTSRLERSILYKELVSLKCSLEKKKKKSLDIYALCLSAVGVCVYYGLGCKADPYNGIKFLYKGGITLKCCIGEFFLYRNNLFPDEVCQDSTYYTQKFYNFYENNLSKDNKACGLSQFFCGNISRAACYNIFAMTDVAIREGDMELLTECMMQGEPLAYIDYWSKSRELSYLEKAASMQNGDALLALSQTYREIESSNLDDKYAHTCYYYSVLIHYGHYGACLELGHLYEEYFIDNENASHYYDIGCDKGNVECGIALLKLVFNEDKEINAQQQFPSSPFTEISLLRHYCEIFKGEGDAEKLEIILKTTLEDWLKVTKRSFIDRREEVGEIALSNIFHLSALVKLLPQKNLQKVVLQFMQENYDENVLQRENISAKRVKYDFINYK